MSIRRLLQNLENASEILFNGHNGCVAPEPESCPTCSEREDKYEQERAALLAHFEQLEQANAELRAKSEAVLKTSWARHALNAENPEFMDLKAAPSKGQ